MPSRLEMIPLFSGSSGNSILVRAGELNLLFDCGQSCKRVDEALHKVGTNPDDIDALFLTHSHSDHISGVDVFVRKHNSKIYATSDTMRAVLSICKKEHDPALDNIIDSNIVELDIPLHDTPVRISCCKTPHDVSGSVCYRVDLGSKSCMIMTDLGHVTEEIMTMACGVGGILIESNYDEEMLITGPYDYMLKRRVGGPYGHLSNVDCAKTIKSLIANGTKKYILGHLSENNNTPNIAYITTVEFLEANNLIKDTDYELVIARRYEPTLGMVID